MIFLVKLYIRLKDSVSDIEGEVIQESLARANVGNKEFGSVFPVKSLRAGKFFEICLDANSLQKATEMVQGISQYFVNAVVEECEYEITEI